MQLDRLPKNDGRAAVFPLGGGNPPPAPKGREQGVPDYQSKVQETNAKILATLAEFSPPPIIPPGRLRIPPGRAQVAHKFHFECDPNLDHFLDLILDRFCSFWGAKLGAFLALLAAKIGQDRSKTRLESLSTSKT